MAFTYEFRDAARLEFDDAADWHLGISEDKRDDFVLAVDVTISNILTRPRSYPIVEGNLIRRALVNRFPYAVFFLLDGDHIVILAVFHTSRNPLIWRGRLD